MSEREELEAMKKELAEMRAMLNEYIAHSKKWAVLSLEEFKGLQGKSDE